MTTENSIFQSQNKGSSLPSKAQPSTEQIDGSTSTGKVAATQFDVLVVGELNIDLILDEIHQLPEIGKEVFAGQMTYTLGSSSAIFAANLSALGMKVAFAAKIGTDDFGDKIIRDLQHRQVDTTMIQKTKEAATGVTVALNKKEQRAMITYPGAMVLLEEADITDEMLRKARHLHVSSVFLQSGLRPGLISLFTRARRLGLTTSLDPQWDPLENWKIDLKSLLPQVDVFLPNTAELLELTGTKSREQGVSRLKGELQIMIVKDGRNGAYGWLEGKWHHQPAFLNNNVVDAIGAGDSFNAGFIYAFLNSRNLEECLRQGALMGAINTTAAGGTSAFDDFEAHREIILQKYNLSEHEITT